MNIIGAVDAVEAMECVETLVAEGVFGTEAQVWVASHGGTICDLAVGDSAGGSMSTETTHNCSCLGKPIMGVAIGGLVASERLDANANLSSLDLPPWAVPRFDCSVLDVLDPATPQDHDPMSITAQYLMVLGWLHSTVILGHLLWSGATVTGDLFDYSLLDGTICSPTTEDPEREIAEAVIERYSDPAADPQN